MKRTALAAALLAAWSSSFAAVSVTETPGDWNLYKGSAKQVGNFPSYDSCRAALQPLLAKQTNVTQAYSCKVIDAISVTLSPGPQPQGEFQVLSCPAGSATGATWQQTRDYVATKTPPFWKAATWAPKTMPKGACPPAPPAPMMHAGWPVDDKTVDFIGTPGVTDIRISSTVQFPQPDGDNTGAFRTVCYRAKMGYYDPIVHPGEKDTSHLHQFFCNDGVNPNTTAATLMSEGGSTARGGVMNKSGVWAPVLVDTLDNSARPGRVAIVYYKTGAWTDHLQTQPVPQGLKMVIGNPSAMDYVRWGVVGFTCDGFAFANDSAEPFTSGQHVIPTKEQCGPGHEVWATAVAPNCWDGVRLDSPDHQSHMAYPDSPWNDHTLTNGCQDHHPVLIPQVAILVITPVGPNDDPGRWVLSSDAKMPASMYAPGDLKMPDGTIVKRGARMHTDYFAGWLPEFQDVWLNKCDRASLDCQAHMLGDGRTMDSFGGN